MAVIQMSFAGEPPGLQPDDQLTPPDTLELHGFVWFERVDPHTVCMRRLPTEERWKHAGGLYQVDRAAEEGGYLLRRVPTGGLHGLSLRALRRVSGHGRTVMPSEAFGLLLGWPARNEIHAALPVGRTREYGLRADLFDGIETALPLAQKLTEERELAVMGVYCAARDRVQGDIAARIPPALSDGYLLIVPGHGSLWNADCLSRRAPPHGWLPCPWHVTRDPILEARLNPRRIHSAWLKLFGPIDYSRCVVPESAKPPAPSSKPERDWFTADRQVVAPSTLSADWQWLADAIAAGREVRIRYDGGTLPESERTIRPEGLFTVTGYEPTYLQAADVSLDEERVFRLDRIAAAWQGDVLVMGRVSQQACPMPSSRSPCHGVAPGPATNGTPAAVPHTPRTEREQDIAWARIVIGDERLLAFLRRCTGTPNILACELINAALDRGDSLDAIFYTGEEFGYRLTVNNLGSHGFLVAFGCAADPEAGDGGEWVVSFSPDGAVQSIEIVGEWVS